MNIQIIGGEEYEWSNPKQRYFADYDLNTAYNILDDMNDADAEKLGFDCMDDVWDLINQDFTITE